MAIDHQAATELKLYIDNHGELYRQRTVPMFQNQVRKKIAGKYDRAKAPKLWAYLVEDGAKRYAKDFASPGEWSKIFTPETRRHLANIYADEFAEQWKLGELDYLIDELKPKKLSHVTAEEIRKANPHPMRLAMAKKKTKKKTTKKRAKKKNTKKRAKKKTTKKRAKKKTTKKRAKKKTAKRKTAKRKTASKPKKLSQAEQRRRLNEALPKVY